MVLSLRYANARIPCGWILFLLFDDFIPKKRKRVLLACRRYMIIVCSRALKLIRNTFCGAACALIGMLCMHNHSKYSQSAALFNQPNQLSELHFGYLLNPHAGIRSIRSQHQVDHHSIITIITTSR